MIIPSIDLMNGKAVQLISGEKKVIEVDDPIQLAEKFSIYGEMAIIDLDAAREEGSNFEIIKKIVEKFPCRVGGGIRTVEQAKKMISIGAQKIIIGTSAFENEKINYQFLDQLKEAIGIDKIIIAVDTRDGKIVTKAWRNNTGIDLIETIENLSKYSSELLFTSVENEGKMSGYNKPLIKKIREIIKTPVTAAGGISTLSEIEDLSAYEMNVQLGMAIYSGKLDLNDAYIAGLNWKSNLIPVITKDRNGQILMLAYINKDALKETLKTGMMCYYSRSRKKLWRKGETSGNSQKLIRLNTDCDNDTLIAMVEQKGKACHQERYSCFENKTFSIQRLQNIIKKRFTAAKKNSYTASLDEKMVRTKINEEAYELISAETREEIIWEAADLLYFTTVLLTKSGVEYSEVLNELKRRNIIGGKNEDY